MGFVFRLPDILRRVFHRSSEQSSHSAAALPEEASWLIVGLGNPGPQYELTRHNVGFLAADRLAGEFSAVPGFQAEAAATEEAVVIKPQTFMNLSGEAVRAVVEKYGIAPEHVVVIHDELDLPAGTVRLKKGGNENGHNGLKSITQHLGTRDYVRVRIGISRPPKGMKVPDYVLSPLGNEKERFEQAFENAAEGAHLVVTEGLSRAQNQIHGRRK
ncbi:aminoacyl-tRNA hydrolase [Corynebacterium yudongzhengii]|uniref:aminoacyl-tRNA hydrolase n=1 Tax=Corynebacterium yudongzhengii TaxID=2080740 RepID=UPI0039A040B9